MPGGHPRMAMNPLLPAAAMMAASVSTRAGEEPENKGAMSMRGIMMADWDRGPGDGQAAKA
jgi:hypothetical protein